jgi:hypothetical protein
MCLYMYILARKIMKIVSASVLPINNINNYIIGYDHLFKQIFKNNSDNINGNSFKKSTLASAIGGQGWDAQLATIADKRNWQP